MNYLIYILIAVVAFMLGRYFWQKGDLISRQGDQSIKKDEGKEKILEEITLWQAQGDSKGIKNDDVEKLLGVSNATAERYLNELENEGKLTQHGKIGQGVFYTLKQW